MKAVHLVVLFTLALLGPSAVYAADDPVLTQLPRELRGAPVEYTVTEGEDLGGPDDSGQWGVEPVEELVTRLGKSIEDWRGIQAQVGEGVIAVVQIDGVEGSAVLAGMLERAPAEDITELTLAGKDMVAVPSGPTGESHTYFYATTDGVFSVDGEEALAEEFFGRLGELPNTATEPLPADGQPNAGLFAGLVVAIAAAFSVWRRVARSG